MIMKICHNCGKELELNMFHKCSTKKDGLQSQCKGCISEQKKEYYQANKAVISKKKKEHYQGNKESISEKKKVYYQENKEDILKIRKIYESTHKEAIIARRKKFGETHKKELAITRKEYYEANKEATLLSVKEYQRKHKEVLMIRHKNYYEANKEAIAMSVKEYQKNNKDYYYIIRERRRTLKKKLPSTLTLSQWEFIKLQFNNKCAYCGEEKPLTQEHFIPLSNGGSHTKENIIPVCLSCNCSKCKRDFEKWYPKHRHYNKEREEAIVKYINNQALTE